LQSAAEAFERAYHASPHHTVLYNLGQAYIGLGRPVEAVNALERLLDEGGQKIDPERRREVEELLARERQRIGRLEITFSPEDAQLFIDGRRVTVQGVLSLTSGRHVIGLRKEGYVPHIEEVEIPRADSVRRSIDLPSEVQAVGQLVISCDLPAVEISVDGTTLGRTPLQTPMLVATGPRTVRLARSGYRAVERRVTVIATKPARLTCPMIVDLRGVRPGRLKVTPSEPFALVSVDGMPHDGSPLPPGPHIVRVEHTGFRPSKRQVMLEPGKYESIAVHLEPTPERVAEREAQSRTQRRIALGFAAGGIALAGASIGLFVWNGERYEDWRATSDETRAAVRAADLQRVDDLATGTAILGAAALITSGILWLTSD
jgi:hypothetical protein